MEWGVYKVSPRIIIYSWGYIFFTRPLTRHLLNYAHFNIFLKGARETASLNYAPILIFLIGVRETASLN